MPRLLFALLLVGLASGFVGCTKQDTPSRTANRRDSRRSDDRDRSYRNEDNLPTDQYLNDADARAAKRRLEALTRDAEDALEKTNRDLRNRAEDALERTHRDLKSRAEDAIEKLEEAATELSEEAKDRAVDAEEEVDRLFDREFGRPRDRRPDERDRLLGG